MYGSDSVSVYVQEKKLTQASKEQPQTICFSQQKIFEYKRIKFLQYLKNPLTNLWKKLCTSAYCF